MKILKLITSKTFLILLIGCFLFLSCTTKQERYDKIRSFYPRAELIDISVNPSGGNGCWQFIVNDSLAKRYMYVQFLSDDEFRAVEIFCK